MTDRRPRARPWLIDHVEEARDTFGEDYWQYGFQPNRNVIEALTQYSYEQGLSRRKVDPEELFVDELLDTGEKGQTRVKPGDI